MKFPFRLARPKGAEDGGGLMSFSCAVSAKFPFFENYTVPPANVLRCALDVRRAHAQWKWTF